MNKQTFLSMKFRALVLLCISTSLFAQKAVGYGDFPVKPHWIDLGNPADTVAEFFDFVVSPEAREPYVVVRALIGAMAYPPGAPDLRMVVRKFDSDLNSWEMLGDAGFNGPCDVIRPAIAVGRVKKVERPYVAFADNEDWAGNSYSNHGTVMRWNGSDWEVVGSRGFTAEPVSFIKIIVSPGGTPYVAYKTEMNGMVVEMFNGLDWVEIGHLGVGVSQPPAPSLTIGENGFPIVTARAHIVPLCADELMSKSLEGPYYPTAYQIFKYNGSSWQALDQNGWANNLYWPFHDHTSKQGSPQVFISHQSTLSSQSWLTLKGGNTTTNFSPVLPYSPIPVGDQKPSIDMAQNGTPYVTVFEQSSTFGGPVQKLKRYNGTAWETVGSEDGYNNTPAPIPYSLGNSQMFPNKVVVIPKSYPGNTNDIGTPYVAFLGGNENDPSDYSMYVHVRRYVQ